MFDLRFDISSGKFEFLDIESIKSFDESCITKERKAFAVYEVYLLPLGYTERLLTTETDKRVAEKVIDQKRSSAMKNIQGFEPLFEIREIFVAPMQI